ncbi:MAG: hypothetical protein MI755_05035 [Sphingomonadales bacterium]|nr:hypothetical protein [Sphingomonadales bacterium]
MFRRTRSLIRELGVRDGFAYAIDQLLARHLGIGSLLSYRFYALPVPAANELGASRAGKVSYRRIERDAPILEALGLEQEVLDFRFNQGAICFGAVREEELIGAVWFALGPFDEDEARCRYIPLPEDRTAWDFGVFVAPEHRLGLTFHRLWQEVFRYLAARDRNWSLSRISAYNPGSLASHERLGSRYLGKARFLRLGRVQVMWSHLPPYLHISFSDRARPVFRLKAPQS